MATVGDVARFVRGVTYSKEHASKVPAPGFTAVLRANNIGHGLNFDDLVFVPDRFVSDEQVVRDGDVVLAMSSGSKSVVGKAALATPPQRCAFGAFCGVIRPSDIINHSLLGYYFQTKAYRNAVSEESKGVNINNLKAEHILERPLPIPPQPEQERIVSKIDELFSDIEEGKRALERVQKLVESYRRSVLKAAVTGELTRDWREKTKGKGESGDALLARILKARREAWEKAELDKMKARGGTPAHDRWKQKYEEPSPPNITDLVELPEGWAWATPVQLEATLPNALTIGPFGSNLKVSDYTSSGVPLIFVRNIRSQEFEGERTKYVSPRKASELSSHVVRGGDILITKMGDPPGDACVYPAHLQDAVITADCIKWSLHPLIPSRGYIAAFINSSVGRAQVAAITKGVAQQKVSLDRFRQIAVALPGAAEQEEIAERLEVEMQRLQAMKAAIDIEMMRAMAARQSVLRAAFCGALVGQDPADEPASTFLERVAARRGGATTKARHRVKEKIKKTR
jgi:type I restriction enzyme S subunit